MKKYIVRLSAEEKLILEDIVKKLKGIPLVELDKETKEALKNLEINNKSC